MGVCRLCRQDKKLINSHIIPERLHRDLKKDNQMVAINGVGPKGRMLLQKGLQEYLLCDDCDNGIINEYYEKPFYRDWFENSPLPEKFGVNQVYSSVYDYNSFKLFHLSVLFRASVSSLPAFEKVSLGKHEEIIRKMLLARYPGPTSTYPMFGYVVLEPKDRSVAPIMTYPEQVRFKDHNCYGTIYGGVYWCVCISSHRNADMERVGLQPDGRMSFITVSINEVGIVKDMAKVLAGGRVGKE